MKNLRIINLELLIIYLVYFIFLAYEGVNFYITAPPAAGIVLVFFALPLYIFLFIIFLVGILSLLKSIRLHNSIQDNSSFIFSLYIILLASSSKLNIILTIIGVIILLLSLYKIYIEYKIINISITDFKHFNIKMFILITISIIILPLSYIFPNSIIFMFLTFTFILESIYKEYITKNKSSKNYALNNSPPSTDTYTNTQSNIPTPEEKNTYQSTSMNNTPKVNFDTPSLSNQHNTSPSSITESIKEVQAEYKSNQNPEESLAQKIQNHYQNNVNSQKTKIVSEPNPNKFRNLFFSVLLILGFLAFAFLSLGGIIVGDLTVSGVLAVGSVILVIDGYLLYLMWFKK